MKRLSLILILFVAACSGSDEPGVDPSTPMSDLMAEGLYQSPDEGVEAAVWEAETTGAPEGVFVAGGTAYTVRQDAAGVGVLTTLDGANVASFALSRDVATYKFAFDRKVAGLDDLILVPHDGFKPEYAPAPGVLLWTGSVVAAQRSSSAEPFLNGDCEITIANEAIETFGCSDIASDSPWIAEISDSWVGTASGASFATELAQFDGVYDDRTFSGVVRVDGEVAGRFTFARD